MWKLEKVLTPSRIFLFFWLSVIGGMVLGMNFDWPLLLIGWFAAIWLLVFLSGHEPALESVAALCLGLSSGVITWQLTQGEAWVHWSVLTKVATYLTWVREQIVSQIFMTLPEPHGSLLAGIILGNRVQLDRNLIKEFQLVGLSHLIAVSGYNLTILTANIQSLFKPFGKWSKYISLLAIVTFVILTGAPASILRAAVMATLLIIGQLIGRPTRALNLLIIGSALLAIFEPKIIFDIGFQLSVAATYALLRLSPLLAQFIRKWWLPGTVKEVLAETLSASIVTAPLIALYFGRLPAIGLVSNILILPIIPFLMGLAIVGCLLTFIFPLLGQYLLTLCYPILQWILLVTDRLSQLTYASITWQPAPWIPITILGLLVLGTELLRLFQLSNKADEGVEELPRPIVIPKPITDIFTP